MANHSTSLPVFFTTLFIILKIVCVGLVMMDYLCSPLFSKVVMFFK